VGEGPGVGDVVDGHEVDVRALLEGGPEEVPADPAEAVDADLHAHDEFLL
jgi:hypothetical protein